MRWVTMSAVALVTGPLVAGGYAKRQSQAPPAGQPSPVAAATAEPRVKEKPVPPPVQAVKDGDLAEVEALLEGGADTEVKARDSDPTALCWAAELGHVEIAQALLEHGAKVNATDNRGNTALRRLLYRREGRARRRADGGGPA